MQPRCRLLSSQEVMQQRTRDPWPAQRVMKAHNNRPVVQTAGTSDPHRLVLVAQIKLISSTSDLSRDTAAFLSSKVFPLIILLKAIQLRVIRRR